MHETLSRLEKAEPLPDSVMSAEAFREEVTKLNLQIKAVQTDKDTVVNHLNQTEASYKVSLMARGSPPLHRFVIFCFTSLASNC